ncbi:MAG: 4-hydroxy-3-methylbut-2-enyl diphosphate reductase [Planctomycetales bacterium 12-60-4]|nr:MAG: 4-hydroxy-3-methylbut-2-enyl diphosphate reductase [Planctomycetales bacterium 12-60-4]
MFASQIPFSRGRAGLVPEMKGFRMQIVVASALGWCFGVRDAVAAANSVTNPAEVTIFGELVHNEQVLQQLQDRGLHQLTEGDRQRLPSTPTVLITAHGISERNWQRLTNAGLAIVDTTCPLVRRVHAAARLLVQEDRHLVVIGQPGHVEVLGIVEDFPATDVWPDVASVTTTEHRRLGVISQSTTRPDVAEAVLGRIRELHPHAEIRWVDTICQPTRDRQRAIEELLDQISVLVVVGGQRSNNSQALAERARTRGIRAHLVQTADQLQQDWFRCDDVVGLTAGTSTPDAAITAVQQRLEAIRQQWN